MITPPNDDTAATERKIAALVEQLRLAERELQELTGGKPDAITAPEGSPILLRLAETLTIETRRLHESQAVANVGSWETDLATLQVTWTEETYRIFETNPEEFKVTHEGFLERVHPDDRERLDAAFLASIGESGSFAIEHRILFPDGRIKFVEERWQTFNDATGTPVRAVGTCQDITERKRSEELIQIRVRQQEAIAKIGFEATRATALEPLFDFTTRAVAAALGVELCKVLQLAPDGTHLRLVSGIGWQPGLIGVGTVGVDRKSQAGFTLVSDGPIYVNDFAKETRFEAPPLLKQHQVVSGLSVTIQLRNKPWGVLGAHSRTVRQFNGPDASFMQAVARLLAVVIERLAVQRTLTESEARMRDAQRIAHLGNWELDIAKNELTWSEEVFRIFGVEPAGFSATYDAFLALVHPDDREAMQAAQSSAIAGRGPLEIEHRIIRGDGEIRFIRERGELIHSEGGLPITLSGTVLDITDLRSAQSQAERMNALLTEAQKIAAMGSWELDMATGRLLWPEETCRLFGIQPGEFGGTFEAFTNFILPEDRPAHSAVHAKITPAAPLLEAEYRIRRPDGTVRWMFERGMVTFDSAGKVTRRLGVVMDITERRLAEEAIRSQSRELTETGQTLTAVTEALAAYVERGDWKAAMSRLLRCALDKTQSEYGFIGVVVGSTLRVLAHEGIVWDKIINREFYEQALRNYEEVGYLEFTSFNNLFGRAITTGKVVIANMPDSDPRSSGRPTGHPPMSSFLGVPIFAGDQVQGMVALANRPGGYSEDEQRQIETLVHHAGGLCTSYRQREAAMVLEQERAKTESERTRIFNLSMDLLSIGNFKGELEQVNPAWTECLGWSAEEITNRPWLDFVHPDDHAATIRAGAEICSGQAIRDFENRYLCKDGSYRWLSWNSHPLMESRQIFCVARDVTERRKNEAQLRLLETCVARLNDIVLITDAEPIDAPGPRILYVNDAFVRRTGFTREEAIGKTPRLLQGPKTQRDALDRIRTALKAWKPVREELINYTKSGEEFWIELEIVPVADEKGWFTHWVAIERDITERKQAEVTLAESQRQYRDLVETSHNVVWAVNVEGRFTFLNQATRAIFGRDPEEMIGRLFHDFVPEDQHPANDEILASMLRDGRDTIDYSNRIRRKDGSIAILNSNARVVRDSEGKMTGISGMSQDITESLKAQAALESSELRLRLALDAARMGTYEWDVPGKRIVWSREHEELWGYAPGEFDGTYEAFAKRLHPDDVAPVNAEISRCISAHGRFVWEFRVVWPDGSLHWMAGIGEFSYDKAGQPLRMHGAVMEITERKLAEEALQASEQEFRNLAEAMPQIVWITRPDGWTTYFNQHWMDYTGMTPEESLGHGWNTVLHPDDQEVAWGAWNKATSEIKPYAIEYRLRRADGDFRWWLARGEPQKDAAGRVLKWFGTCTDIHDLKVAELEIIRTNRALKMLSGCNEALIHADDEMTLLRDVCQLAMDIGGYRMAWVGYAQDDDKRTIKPMAHAGIEDGYLAEISLTWNEQIPSGKGPAGRVIRSGEPIVCEDMANDEFFMWLDPARRRGYRSVICLPLRDKQRTFGLLGLYSAEVHVANANELKLLREMADDLAFGILTLRSRIDQRRTHEAVLAMARGISASTGDEFFEKLTYSMVQALGAHAGFIARLNDDKSMANTLCAVVDGKLAPDFEYALSGTPCEHLGGSDVWVVPKDVWQRHPQANLLQYLNVNAYAGTELYDADGKPCGQMCVLFQQPLEEHEFISSTLKIFASRAAGELERQKTEGRLREQAALLDKAQDAILVRDLNHKILYWNRSAERLYGWSAEEAVGRSVRELIYRDTDPLDAAQEALIEEDEWVGEVQQFNKVGKVLTVEGRWSLVRDEQGNPKSVLAINTDITERKKIEAQFLRAQRMESIGTLAGGIAHDLNNVLAPIMMAIELLKMQEKNPMRLSVLTTIEGSAKRGADMVKQVLSFARGVEGQQLEVQVGHLLREIEKIANETFLKNIQVYCDVPAELWLVKGDPTQLHQVLLNLCVNARDAMPDGGRLSLTASNLMVDEQYAGMNIEAKPGPHVCIQVEDNGTGMPPDVIERIFEPFFTTKELGKGTGLGLSTTLAIIKSHGGFVRVYSEVGMGTRFHVYLPAQTEPGAVGSEAAEPELPRGHSELVLVIDDEAAVRQITRQTLEAFGYRVLLATDGVEATTIYATRQHEIDVVLTDMMMPLMDGPTTIQVLLRMNPQARIIAASGLNANGMVAKAINAGVKHFIPKPYTAETLLKTLRDVLGEQVVIHAEL